MFVFAALTNGHPERQLGGAAGFDPGHQSGHSCAQACRGAASPMGDPAWLLLSAAGENLLSLGARCNKITV